MAMKALQPKPLGIYSKRSTVYAITDRNKFHCLKRALDASQFFEDLNARFANWKEKHDPNSQEPDKLKGEFRIAIKPNFMCAGYETDISVFTDVDLVEYLIGLIRNRHYTNISVVESQMVWSVMRDGRDVKTVADMLGYSGKRYRIVDLSIGAEKCDYDEETVGQDYGHSAWGQADYRISFAKNKTHFQCYYTGCMKNVYGCLPQQNKLWNYHVGPRGHDRKFHTAAIGILEKFPVDFALLDAFISSDGIGGLIRDGSPNATHTILCGESCLAVDWVQGLKMRLDPMKNYVVQRACERWRAPKVTVVEERGVRRKVTDLDKLSVKESWRELTLWKDWHNVPWFFVRGSKFFEKWYGFARFLCFVFAYRMDERFKPVRGPRGSATVSGLVKFLDVHSSDAYLLHLGVDLLLAFALVVAGVYFGSRAVMDTLASIL